MSYRMINELPSLKIRSYSTQKDYNRNLNSIEIRIDKNCEIKNNYFRPSKIMTIDKQSNILIKYRIFKLKEVFTKLNKYHWKNNNGINFKSEIDMDFEMKFDFNSSNKKPKTNPIKNEVFYKLTGNVDIKNLIQESNNSNRNYLNYMKTFYKLKNKNDSNQNRSISQEFLKSKINFYKTHEGFNIKNNSHSNSLIMNNKILNQALSHRTSKDSFKAKTSSNFNLYNSSISKEMNNSSSLNKTNIKSSDCSTQIYKAGKFRDKSYMIVGQVELDQRKNLLEYKMNTKLLNCKIID